MAADVLLVLAPFDPARETAEFTSRHPEAGGVVSFLGQVRAGGGCEALELSYYEPLTLPGMQDLAADALGRWALDGLLIIHRTGIMLPGDPIVLVVAAARHRRDAFAAADFADHLDDAFALADGIEQGSEHFPALATGIPVFGIRRDAEGRFF